RFAPVVLAALVAGAGYLLAGRYLNLPEDAAVILVAVFAALVLHWLLNEPVDALRGGIAAIVWVGLSTVAFGLGKGLGMSMALVAAAAVLATLRSRYALLSMTPLIGLVLYRVLRDAQPISIPELEAAQYQALVGIIVGAILPLLPQDWLSFDPPASKRLAGTALWAVVLVGVPVAMLVLTGSRGTVGFLVGIGLSGPIAVLRGGREILPLGYGLLSGSVVVASYGWLYRLAAVERAQRIWILIGIALAVSVVGILLAALTPRPAASRESA
ncbi:MAG TPA: hypothetical protein VGE01_01040, partial [Fimbriimonas sp.]